MKKCDDFAALLNSQAPAYLAAIARREAAWTHWAPKPIPWPDGYLRFACFTPINTIPTDKTNAESKTHYRKMLAVLLPPTFNPDTAED